MKSLLAEVRAADNGLTQQALLWRVVDEAESLEEHAEIFERDNQRLIDQRNQLITLVRIGFLVADASADMVKDPELRSLLFSILQAEDTATAIGVVSNAELAHARPNP